METPLIRYNLKDRGRVHSGKPRSFNIRAVADAINSPACQEMVASRSMVGFYGHMPRVRFGMNPAECGIDGGKYLPVEPAFVTTHLKADYDGNVEHKAEFLDTASGMVAAKLWNSKVGGFSSAIDEGRPAFYGFDYVNAPNFVGNSFRGVVLDDAFGGNVGLLTYDDVYQAELDERAQGVIILLDSISAERALFNETVERLTLENEQLLSILASKGVDAAKALDSAFESGFVVDVSAVERMRRDRELFMSSPLPQVVAPQVGEQPYDKTAERILNRAWR